MCGIIGYIGTNDTLDVIIDGLKRLEYRGYDSAGIAFIDENGAMDVIRCQGKINDLVNKIGSRGIKSKIGIGHTRWATHGIPSDENAHPHRSGNISVVHNGIIENYTDLKHSLIEEGFTFSSDTDTEVICHLIEMFYTNTISFDESVRKAINLLEGSFALAIINEKEPEKIICIKKDSPLVIGLGDGEFFVASDVPAFLNYTRDVIFLDDNQIAILSSDGVAILDSNGISVEKKTTKIMWSPAMAEKGGYRHFMSKEIFEQPRAVADTIRGRIIPDKGVVNLSEFGLNEKILNNIKKIFLVACGTSWHAALYGKFIIEELNRVPVEVDIASEFRYRNPIIGEDDLFIAITQSGETADTLAALREAKKMGAKTLTICNVTGSTASRESDFVFYTHSGPEIGVASTKAFVTQLISLYLFAVALNHISSLKNKEIIYNIQLINELLHIPTNIEQVLSNDDKIEKLAKELFKAEDFLYLGRGIIYPIALEGALKLKEISYIHAEGYPAGEMKHGPIALIDENMPVVILLSNDALSKKIISNIEEVKSRGGKTIVISNYDSSRVRDLSDFLLLVPESNQFINPIIMAIPLQLLAYHIGVIRGCDVDQPRNLAKSVTVE